MRHSPRRQQRQPLLLQPPLLPPGAAKPAAPLTAAAPAAATGVRPVGLGAASPFRAAPGGVPAVSHAHGQPPKEMEDAADEFDDEDDDE